MNKYVIILLLFLAGCRTSKPVIYEHVVTKDSVVYVVRDTTIIAPADSSHIKALLECDSLGNVLIKQIENMQGRLNARQNLTIQDNVLEADCICDSMSIYATLRDRHQTTTTAKTVYVEIEKELKWWQKAMIGAGWVFSLAFIIFIFIELFLKKPL